MGKTKTGSEVRLRYHCYICGHSLTVKGTRPLKNGTVIRIEPCAYCAKQKLTDLGWVKGLIEIRDKIDEVIGEMDE